MIDPLDILRFPPTNHSSFQLHQRYLQEVIRMVLTQGRPRALSCIGIETVEGSHRPDRNFTALWRVGVHIIKVFVIRWIFQFAKKLKPCVLVIASSARRDIAPKITASPMADPTTKLRSFDVSTAFACTLDFVIAFLPCWT